MSLKKGIVALGLAVLINLLYLPNVKQESVSIVNSTFPTPDDLNLTQQLLEQDGQVQKFEHNVDRFLNYWNIQGASVSIAREGKIIYTNGFGLADTVSKTPVQPSHMFRMASVSKLVTAVAIMQLCEDGKLKLDSHVFGENGVLNFAPYNEYRDKKVEQIEVRHLLNHSGGWTTRYGDPMFINNTIARRIDKDELITTEDIIAYMLTKRLHFTPGTASYYSNLGFAILSKVIEAASGMPYETYVKANILDPLGIQDMRLGKNTHEEWLKNEVCYYEQPDARKVNSIYGTDDLVRKCDGGSNIEALQGAGAWIGTSLDVLKLVLTVDGEDTFFDILSKESIEAMVTPDHTGFSPYGWRTTQYHGDWLRTGTLAGSTALVKKGEKGLTYVILCNTSPWKGSEFPFIMRRFLDSQIRRVDAFQQN